ncbi:MAG: phosphoribulokinase, partial [Psychrosphaera sp.]|nr:phosphoribulokinase [Psychrosphaera sp.]
MSNIHPIIAITGSSGAGTTTTPKAKKQILRTRGIEAALGEGDSYHRNSRPENDVE